MKKYLLLGLLILGLVLWVRVAQPWDAIFSNNGVRFTDNDSYFHARIIRDIVQNNYDTSEYAYTGYDKAVAAVASLAPSAVAPITAIAPVVIFLLTLIPLYLIGWMLWGHRAAIVALLAFTIMPGEYLMRSIIGAADHHAAEVLITTSMLAALVSAFREIRLVFKILGVIIVFALYFILNTVWQGSIIFAGIVALCAIVRLDTMQVKRLHKVIFTGFAVLIGLTVAAVLLPPYLAASGLTALTTIEAIPLLLPPFNLMSLVHVALAIYLSVRLIKNKPASPPVLILVVWTISIILMTLWQRRFDYYLTVPLALLLGWGVIRLAESLNVTAKTRVNRIVAGIAACLVVMLLPWSVALARSPQYVPPANWQAAMVWLKQNTAEDSKILAWWDYGYWIEYMANRRAVVTPGQSPQKVKDVALIFSETDMPLALAEIEQTGAKYLVIDYRTAKQFQHVVSLSAGRSVIPASFMVSVYDGFEVQGMELVYQAKDIKIWRVS